MKDEARVMSRMALPEETQVERQLRPQRLDEYVGQRAAVESLRISVEAARQRREPLDHVLLSGPPGLGKTTLATIMANEMGAAIVTTAGPSLERGADLMGILTNLNERDVLFIDEIHRLPRVVEELLYPAMEDFSVNFVMDKGLNARTMRIPLRPFTLVGATTRPGMLSSPLRERFGIFHHLDFYSDEELGAIIRQFNGGPAGLEAIAATINDEAETLAEVVEPFLLKIGFVVRTPNGRKATPAAYAHLRYAAPPSPGGQTQLPLQ